MRPKFTSETARLAGKASGNARKSTIKLTKQLAKLGLTESIVGDLKDIIVELVRASNTNPIVGAAVALVTVDILRRMYVIDSVIFDILVGIISASAGIDILSKLEGPLSGLLGGSSNADLLKPTGVSPTYAEQKGKPSQNIDNQMAASLLPLLGRIAAVVPK